MTKEELEEIENDFGFSLQQNKLKKPLSEITKEEYIGLMLTIFEQIFKEEKIDVLPTNIAIRNKRN